MADRVEKSEIAKKEEEILKFWQENKIFEKSLEKPSPKGDFVFYDGPPFATGLPHFGHLLPTSIKDAIPRFQTMRGYRVIRRWGWDCHGLPIENLIEKELSLESKKDIENYGLDLFNQKARESVLRYADEWKRIIPRLGRWVDMENDYKTMNPSYTESVWWVFKTLFDKGLVYEGYKSMHLCPRCETTLANFEVNLGYKDIVDLSVYVKFELVDEVGTYLLAWTTTPWTLPGNAALAVNEKFVYSKLKIKNEKGESEFIILAKDRITEVFKDKEFEVIEEFEGKKLLWKKYKPPFDYYQGSTLKDAQGRTLETENGWQILAGDFVSGEEGTGVVHIAPAFGEDDMRFGEENHLPFIQHVTRAGRFKDEISDFAGLPVKPKDDHQSSDVLVIKYLANKKLLFKKEKITHSYPHCWRCDTPLLNYASASWFIKVTDLKDKLLAENQKVVWIPEHIKEGRFGKWLAGARDWAVSRQRFWGAPLPIWRCSGCTDIQVLGSIEELKKNTKTAGNHYFVIRHGEADNNVLKILSSRPDNPHHLTDKGRQQVIAAATQLKEKKIDLIISSDFVRTRETAEILSSSLNLNQADIIYDVRLRETNHGDWNGKSVDFYHAQFKGEGINYYERLPAGESYADIKRRMGSLIYDLESKYQGKKILIVTHESPSWLLFAAAAAADVSETLNLRRDQVDFIANGEFRSLPFVPLPHNQDYELDLHRPVIDQVKLICRCGGELTRVEDVFDVWFESGSMPYGQSHHPFSKSLAFPADFVAEGIDQTRGWFYSLLVLGVGVSDQSPYKKVVVNGLILAEDGQKMSKRLKNYPDLDLTIDKYGADALRFYLLSSPAARAEEFSFSEKSLGETMRRVILRLKNVLAFFQVYAGPNSGIVATNLQPTNVLDRWILSRLAQLNEVVSKALETCEVDRLGKPVDDFVDDLSTWYLRRSRDRFRTNDESGIVALEMFRQILLTLSKLLAPITPFVAEEIYQALRLSKDCQSVHLESWPETGMIDQSLISTMSEIRRLISIALEERTSLGLRVRQPLARVTFSGRIPDWSIELLDLIKEEVNVKKVEWQADLGKPVLFDTVLTEELRAEGEVRELIRKIQDSRKQLNLSPKDQISSVIRVSGPQLKLLLRFQENIKEAVGAKELTWEESSSEDLEVKIAKV